ncbi:MAG: glycosyltransferase family 39 protein [Chloroflexi bacterium]|nr:glycosyltransferase family 39 protein [Chloroflexota bacterium]
MSSVTGSSRKAATNPVSILDPLLWIRAQVGSDRVIIWVSILALTFLAAVLRIYNIENQSLWRDEGISYSLSHQDSLPHVFSTLANNDLHPPFYFVLLYFAIELLGKSAFTIRIISAIAGIILIPLGYSIGKRLFNSWVGLLNALIMTISPFLIRYSQEARQYNLLALMAAFTFYFAIRWIQKPSNRQLIPYVITGALLIYTHTWGFFFLAALNLYLVVDMWLDPARRRQLPNWIAGNVAIGVLYLPWLPSMIHQLGFRTDWITTTDSPFKLLRLTFEYWTAAARATPFYLLVFLLGIIYLLDIEVRPFKMSLGKDTGKVMLLIVTGLATLVIALVMNEFKPSFKPDRYTIVVYPIFSLLLALGIINLRFRWVMLGALFILMALWARKDLYYLRDPYKSVARDVAADLNANIKPNDVIVFTPDPLGQSVQFYLTNDNFMLGYANWTSMSDWNIDGWVDAWFKKDLQANTFALIDEHLTGDACVWLVFEPGPISIPDAENVADDFLAAFDQHYQLVRKFVGYDRGFSEPPFEDMDLAQYCGKREALTKRFG